MNEVERKEQEVLKCQERLKPLIAEREKLMETVERLEIEKKEATARKDQKAYEKVFGKISSKSFERDTVEAEIGQADVALSEARSALKTLKDEQQARLENHIRIREQEDLDAFVRELPSLQEKIIQHYFELCQEIASIQTRGSKLSVNGAPTPRCQAIAEFWNLFPHCLIEAFKENTFTIAPRPWAEEIRLQPYLKGSGSFAGAIAENLGKEKEAFTKEFFVKEEI